MRLRHAEFPRHAGIADRTDRAGAGATVVAGNGDQVRACLHHTCRNGAHAGMADKLHRDQRAGVDLLEVVDQLGEVFDRIDVVMRRRRDQADAGPGVAQARDQLVDLVARQLAAFAGLGALGDLDLQHFGVDQVFRGHAEAAGGDLLDLAALLGAVTRRVFAAFARVAAAAEAVHRDGERFVRLRRQRAQRDRCGVEAAQQVGGVGHLVDRRRRIGLLQLQQVAQRRRRPRVHRVRVRLPVAGVAGARRALQRHHHVRVVHVVLAAVHVLQQAADVRRLALVPGARVQLAGFQIEPFEADAADPRRRFGEAQVDDLRIQPDDLEQLRAAVAADGADAHLRDDLRQALVDALAVAAADLRLLAALLDLQDAAPAQVEQRLVGQVRVHRGGAHADQAGDMVRVARGAGLDDQVDVAAQAFAAQVMVHRAGGEQGMHHRPALLRAAVAQHHHHHALARGLRHLGADALDGALHAFRGVVRQVDVAVLLVVRRHLHDLPQLALGQHRRVEDDVVHRLGPGVEDVGLPAQLGGQRHHAVFAQRIDRRVGDLRERLAEVVVQRPRLPAQHGHGRVVAHRAGGLLLGLRERTQHLLHLLGRELEQLVVTAQRLLVERRIGQRRIDQLGLQVGDALVQPLLVRRAAAVDAVHRFAVEQVAALEVDGHHLARAQLALAGHAFGRHFPHAGFAGDDEVAVAGQHPARGAQAVAVQRARGVARIHRDDAGRPVPRLGVQSVELVERGEVGVLELQRLRGRWHQDAQRLDQLHAAGDQQLQHVVQALRIRAVHRDDRVELADVEARRLPHLAARLRPAAVALDGVDLAVVRQQAERMRQRPARQRVGGEALVEDHRAAGQLGALQVGVERRQLVRQHHALVADGVRRQRHHIEIRHGGAQLLFAAAAGEEQRQREGVAALLGARFHEQLLDARQGVLGQLSAYRVVGRWHAPPLHRHAGAEQFGLQGGAAVRGKRVVVREEDQAGGEARAGVDAGFGGERAEEGVRFADQQAAAVAGQPVGGDAAAMGHARERGNGGVDERARRLVVELRDHAETAGVAFVVRVVETGVKAALAMARGHVLPQTGVTATPCPARAAALRNVTGNPTRP